MRDEQWRNKKRRGRPRWSGEFTSGKCDVRLTSEENSMLNELADYAEDDTYTDTVYGYVPVEIVDKLIEKHGGIVDL